MTEDMQEPIPSAETNGCGAGKNPDQILSGIRVFDLSIVTAGAGCTQILADFGAEVIKVESADRPDLFRGWIPSAGGDDLSSAPFRTVNRNKKGFGVDLKNPDGLAVARRLIAECDIVVENYRHGVLDRLGLGFDRLVELRPDIVLVSVASQGTTGPNRYYGSFGSVLDALGGTMSITGYDEHTPRWSSYNVNYPDQAAAMLGPALMVLGVLAARASRRPQWIDMSQRELVTHLVAEHILLRSLGGPDPVPTANSSRDALEWATQCAGDDEWVAISLFSAADQAALCTAIGKAPASADELELRALVAAWSQQLTKSDAMDQLQQAGICAAAVLKGHELWSDPYFESVDYFQPVELPDGGSERQRGPLVRFDRGDEPAAKHRRAPHVGEHTVEIMTDLLGAATDEVERLLRAGAITQFAAEPQTALLGQPATMVE